MPRNNSYGTQDDSNSTNSFCPTPPDNAGISPTDPGSSEGVLTVSGHNPITTVWQDLVSEQQILHYFIVAARKAVTGRDPSEIETLLDKLEITDNPSMGHDPREMIHRLQWKPAVAKECRWTLIRIIQELGTGSSTVEDILSMANLFQFIHDDNPHIEDHIGTPVVTVEIEYETFKALTRSQRTDICRLLHVLSKAFDIRLAATQKTQAFLKQYHRDELPCVSEWTITQWSPSVDEALAKLDPTGTPAAILAALAAEPDRTLSYSELYEIIQKSDSRVRQCIRTLNKYGLVTSFGSPKNKKVTLLDSGSEILDNLKQQRKKRFLAATSSARTPNSDRHKRERANAISSETVRSATKIDREVSHRLPTADRTAPQHNSSQNNSEYPTGRMCPSMRDAVAACGDEEGTITIVDDGIDHLDSSVQLFGVNENYNEVIVSTHATTPLDYTVGSAMALAHPKLINDVLSEETLTDILDDTPTEILSWARQIAYVSFDEVESEALQKALLQWRTEIEDLTRRLGGESEANEFNRDGDLVTEILRQAHGLVGCIVHLLDEAGISVVRDIRIPSSLNSSKIETLSESIAHSITVQSRYKRFSAYRQLFEAREGHRTNSFTVDVDAADPFGTLIGAFVLRGGGATRVEPELVTKLKSYEPVEDAPELAIPITVREATRDNVVIAAERVLDRKNIAPTQKAISTLNAVVDSPFGVTRALEYLGASSEHRGIESIELRYALQQLPEEFLLSDLPRSVGQVVKTLLCATKPITQKELADRADVTTQTIRNHEVAMVSTGVVQFEREASGGKKWRMALSFDWEQDNLYPSIDFEESLRNLISDKCGCSGTCVTQEDNRVGSDRESCPVQRWRQVQIAVNGGQEVDTRLQYEVLLGDSPKQTSILDASGFMENSGVQAASDEDNLGDHSQDVADDEEIDLDFSGISIPGSSEDYSDSTTC